MALPLTLDNVTGQPWEMNPTPQSVGRVRRVVSTAARAAGAEPNTVELAALLASEVATNVVLHARTPYSVAVSGPEESGTRGRLRVAVSDGSPALPAGRRHAADATTGRGLRLLRSLAAAHGIEVHGSGKTVWFEVTLHATEVEDEDALMAAFDEPMRWSVAEAW